MTLNEGLDLVFHIGIVLWFTDYFLKRFRMWNKRSATIGEANGKRLRAIKKWYKCIESRDKDGIKKYGDKVIFHGDEIRALMEWQEDMVRQDEDCIDVGRKQ